MFIYIKNLRLNIPKNWCFSRLLSKDWRYGDLGVTPPPRTGPEVKDEVVEPKIAC